MEMASSHRLPMRISSTFSWRSCSSNLVLIDLTKPSCNVIFGAFILWHREQLLGAVKLNHLAQQEKRSFVGDTGCLLHIVGDHDDGVIFFQLAGKLLDFGG